MGGTTMDVAVAVGVVLLAVIGLFQLALAAGAPWGHMAYGGQRPGRLPVGFRIASGFSGVVLYPLIGAVLLAVAGRIAGWSWMRPGVLWGLVGFFALGTLANGASRSRAERVWSPVCAALAVCCGVVAAGV